MGLPWRGSLRDLVHIVNDIRRLRAFGRLTLRSTTHIGLAHFYFRAGKLVHIVSNSGDANATLAELQHWTRAVVHFERGIPTGTQNVSKEHELMFDNLLLKLQKRSFAPIPERPSRVATFRESTHVIEGQVIATPGAEQLITPQEWYVLVESIRRVSLAVAHLVGQREAVNVLRDILEDFSSAFPALSSLHIAPGGYLQMVRTRQLDRIPRKQVIEGFAALIVTCRHFCTPMIGEENARRLILRALNDIGPALASLGIANV